MKAVHLKVILLFLAVACSLLPSCKKDEPRLSGTDTIDNTLVLSGQVFAVNGFSFELGRVISNLEPPGPDITINLQTDSQGNVTGKYFDSDNLVESFAKVGDYASAAEAKEAFDNLLEVGSPAWSLAAWDVEENQVWLFKTSEGNYVKFRVSDILVDELRDPPYIEVTFQWRIQPDGSTSFSN